MKDKEQLQLLKDYHDSIYKESVDFDRFDDEYREALSKMFGFSLFRLQRAFRNLFYALKNDVYRTFGIRK